MSKVTITKKTRKNSVRTDRWVNERNRFGGASDPVSRTTFSRDLGISRGLLDSLYRYDWLTRKAVDIPAEDGVREWIKIRHDDPKRVQAAERELSRLGIQSKIEELIRLSRLYGGGLLIVGAWDGRDVTEPLGNVRKVFWTACVDRYLAYPLGFYTDKESDKYGEVETYQVTRPLVQGTDVAVVHESRVVRLDGLYLPPLERIRNFTYGGSIVENIIEATKQFGICSQALAGVVQDFITKKLKVENLQDLLQTQEGLDSLMTRIGELAAGMSLYSVAVFGKDEEFDKMGTPITGLPDLADRFVEYASAATGIPRARLFNNLSGRLGGDAGENDLRVHYDTIGAFQRNRLKKPIQQTIDIALAPIGFEPGECEFEFNPLWQISGKEKAEIYQAVSIADQNYINAGVLQPEEVAMSRFAGDGINTDDMHIETEPREKFLEEFRKTEPRSFDPDDPDGSKAKALEAAKATAEAGGNPDDEDGQKPDDEDDVAPEKKNGAKKAGNGAAAKH